MRTPSLVCATEPPVELETRGRNHLNNITTSLIYFKVKIQRGEQEPRADVGSEVTRPGDHPGAAWPRDEDTERGHCGEDERR